MSLQKKLDNLSSGLRAKIHSEIFNYEPLPDTPVSNFLVRTKKHCNAGITTRAALKIREHCDSGGRLIVTLAGAASTFEIGIELSELIRQGKVAAISCTGANLEESLYRPVSPNDYAYIPEFLELSVHEEKELDNNDIRRITGTFLPEEETVRVVLPQLEKRWRHAEETGSYKFWHEYFFELFEYDMLGLKEEDLQDCWLYWAWKHGVEVIVGGAEDSTMGNIFSHASYSGTSQELLSKYKLEKPINPDVVLHSFRYMHRFAEWYLNNTQEKGFIFVQLGGSIAGDFPICVIPHLKKDFFGELPIQTQEKLVRALIGFVEIHLTPMSAGSYGGAGYKEKVTWGKTDTNSWGAQIYGDFTTIFPDIAAIILRR